MAFPANRQPVMWRCPSLWILPAELALLIRIRSDRQAFITTPAQCKLGFVVVWRVSGTCRLAFRHPRGWYKASFASLHRLINPSICVEKLKENQMTHTDAELEKLVFDAFIRLPPPLFFFLFLLLWKSKRGSAVNSCRNRKCWPFQLID